MSNDTPVSSATQDYDTPYRLEPHEFIYALFSRVTEGWIEVTYVAPEDARIYPRVKVQWAQLPLGEIDPALPHIIAMNQRGYNCYVGVTVRQERKEPVTRTNEHGREYTMYPRGHESDASYLTALWVDCDLKDAPDALARVNKCTALPNIIVSTGGGFHAYWLLHTPVRLTDEKRQMVKRTLKGMAIALGTDSAVADLARIMRLPGTVNTKPGRGQVCEVIDYLPGYYHYEDFELNYAPLAAPKAPAVKRVIPIHASSEMPKWVRTYLDNGAVQGERNRTAYAAARSLLDNGWSQMEVDSAIRNRAALDGLPDSEIDALLSSAARAERSAPNLPRHMMLRMAMGDKR